LDYAVEAGQPPPPPPQQQSQQPQQQQPKPVQVVGCDLYLSQTSKTPFHTFTLLPAHNRVDTSLACPFQPATPSPSSSSSSSNSDGGVCCFLSTALDGWLYQLARPSLLLAQYFYQRPTNAACITDYLVRVLVGTVFTWLTCRLAQLHVCVAGFDGGIDTYTIRNALPQMGLKPSPDISLLGSKRMIKCGVCNFRLCCDSNVGVD
jgi:hypothetical protein